GPNQLVIISDNSDEGEDIGTQATIAAPADGEMSFYWCYSTFDDDPSYDPGYYINGTRVDLSDPDGPNFQDGVVTVTVTAGDQIGFGVESTDTCCGSGIMMVNDFSITGIVCEPVEPTCTGDLDGDGVVGGGDLLTFLAAFGNVCE
ncbi:MAG: hypothetical protein HRT74_10655, partial [Flavobacteriales bacterium]|nr:hypothetical protein [Flavobacteriales bacterium]